MPLKELPVPYLEPLGGSSSRLRSARSQVKGSMFLALHYFLMCRLGARLSTEFGRKVFQFAFQYSRLFFSKMGHLSWAN